MEKLINTISWYVELRVIRESLEELVKSSIKLLGLTLAYVLRFLFLKSVTMRKVAPGKYEEVNLRNSKETMYFRNFY